MEKVNYFSFSLSNKDGKRYTRAKTALSGGAIINCMLTKMMGDVGSPSLSLRKWLNR